ncbi:heavy-metal-associated domain-containing protein [Loigolactobacillus rennini]|nr:heavy metal-associated domain-containing protein [Loigolactobacillus rennini]SFZ87741.1 hypothetical protein LREN565_0854 [Loigolactobacillus rennini]
MAQLIKIKGMKCDGCVKSVTAAFENLPDVKTVKVNLEAGEALITGQAEEAALKASLAETPYEITAIQQA